MAVASPLARSLDTARATHQSRDLRRRHAVVTCYLGYLVDPFKLKEFEIYGKMWIPLVEKFGGKHVGYFMPSEGINNVALALFTFPSLAAYEVYRTKAAQDPDCQTAMRYYEETKCFLSLERSFFRPVLS
jgi:NIPSNAP